MSLTLPEPLKGSILYPSQAHKPRADGEGDDVLRRLAAIAAEASGVSVDLILEPVRAARAMRAKQAPLPDLVAPDLGPHRYLPRTGPLVDDNGLPFEHRVTKHVERVRPSVARSLARNQRRLLRTRSERDVDLIARRLSGKNQPQEQQHGVWSREVYRRIRAGVQDTSGRAAECLLYMLGTHEAAALAHELDARVPMDRRTIALFYALASAPSNKHFHKLKLGLPLGLFSAVLADPNNVNMERRRKYRPSRRTLYTDLERLERVTGLNRWQMPVELAEPCEMKRDAKHPTNRYWVPAHRDGVSMMLVAQALGDVVPAVSLDPDAPLDDEDRAALKEARASWLQPEGTGALVPDTPSG